VYQKAAFLLSVLATAATVSCTRQGAEPSPTVMPTASIPVSALPTPTPSRDPGFGSAGVAGLKGTPPPRAQIREGEGALTATSLRAVPACEGARSIERLSWEPAKQRGSEQRIAVSTREDGFETGVYRVSAALSAGATRYTLRELQPGGVYQWRVLTRHGDRYDTSDTATFDARACAVDSPG
jgi:hypothetical protein